MKITTTFLSIAAVLLLAVACVNGSAEPSDVTYLFVFGASYSTTSFDITGPPPSINGNPLGNPPIGQGTMSGGPNYIADLATKLNRTKILAYDIAVSGATANNSVAKGAYQDLVSQVGTFERNFGKKTCNRNGENWVPWTSENAIATFEFGINDSNYTASQTTFDLSALITGLSRSYRTLLERLHAAGLRRFLLFGVPPVYRAPFGRQKSAEWRARSKKAVEAVNKVYAQTVREFGALHRDSKIHLYDTFSFFSTVLDDPTRFGFPNATCVNSDGENCIWWNTLHPGWRLDSIWAKNISAAEEGLGL